jgi:hypothetical protein
MRPVSLTVAAASVLALACAHAPASPRAASDQRVLVTGSHIPQRIEGNPCLPTTSSLVVVYPAAPFAQSGIPTNLALALARSNFGVPCEAETPDRPAEE